LLIDSAQQVGPTRRVMWGKIFGSVIKLGPTSRPKDHPTWLIDSLSFQIKLNGGWPKSFNWLDEFKDDLYNLVKIEVDLKKIHEIIFLYWNKNILDRPGAIYQIHPHVIDSSWFNNFVLLKLFLFNYKIIRIDTYKKVTKC